MIKKLREFLKEETYEAVFYADGSIEDEEGNLQPDLENANWDAFTNDFTTLYEKFNPQNNLVYLTSGSLDWRGNSGTGFYSYQNAQQFLDNILSLDPSYIKVEYDTSKKELLVKFASHDVSNDSWLKLIIAEDEIEKNFDGNAEINVSDPRNKKNERAVIIKFAKINNEFLLYHKDDYRTYESYIRYDRPLTFPEIKKEYKHMYDEMFVGDNDDGNSTFPQLKQPAFNLNDPKLYEEVINEETEISDINALRNKLKEMGYRLKTKQVNFTDLARGSKTVISVITPDGKNLYGGVMTKEFRDKHIDAFNIVNNFLDKHKEYIGG